MTLATITNSLTHCYITNTYYYYIRTCTMTLATITNSLTHCYITNTDSLLLTRCDHKEVSYYSVVLYDL